MMKWIGKWSRRSKEEKTLAPVIGDLVLSKSTVSLRCILGARQKFNWLLKSVSELHRGRYFLYLWLLSYLLLSIEPFSNQFGSLSFLLHPAFLFNSVYSALCCTVAMGLFVAAGCIELLFRPGGVKSLVNSFPDVLRVRSDSIELCWNKQRLSNLSLFIPFEWIVRVKLIDCYYIGAFPLKILELELNEIPQNHNSHRLLSVLAGEGIYQDAKSQTLPDFETGGIRIPLPLFAFAEDARFLIQKIVEQRGQDVMDEEAQLAFQSASIESFTTLWLNELHSPRPEELQPRTLPPGTELFDGTYKINEVLGHGAFSVVYGATAISATAESSLVAIKEIVCSAGGSRSSVERNLSNVLSETTMLRDLTHPNIVEFREFFVHQNRLYLVMNAVSGQNLRDYGVNRKMNQNELLQLATQCCSILEYLHNRAVPILHRDFTPDNLIVHEGHITLVDFNVAQAAMTMSCAVVGKHCYMAPEQFCGEYTTAGDVYQLGKTFYYLATGVDPEPLENCILSEKRPDLSPGFIDLIARLTDRDPSNRLTSGEVSSILQSLALELVPKCLEVR